MRIENVVKRQQKQGLKEQKREKETGRLSEKETGSQVNLCSSPCHLMPYVKP